MYFSDCILRHDSVLCFSVATFSDIRQHGLPHSSVGGSVMQAKRDQYLPGLVRLGRESGQAVRGEWRGGR